MRRLVWVLALWPALAAADRMTLLSGAEIEEALSGRALVYTDGATQDFRASGATLYNAGRDSWGTWSVRGNQYCSQWPPSDGWSCYDVATNGTQIRFIADDDSYSDGTYSD